MFVFFLSTRMVHRLVSCLCPWEALRGDSCLFKARGSEERGHTAALCAPQGTGPLQELGRAQWQTEQTRASETPWRCTSVRWDDSSSYSHDVCAATVQQPATPTSYTHFVLQPISSLRKVPIRKLTNRLAIPDVKMFAWAAYTGRVFFLFFFNFVFSVLAEFGTHSTGNTTWKHYIHLVLELIINSPVTLLSDKDQRPDPVVRYLSWIIFPRFSRS